MQYRNDKYGNPISVLGYGCMRFTKDGNKIDIDKAEKELMAAYEAGVNYFDTAYIYSGSEAALGEILERNGIREKVHIATKLPHYILKTKENAKKCFAEELRRLRTDYIDYYLMHMLTDLKTWERMKQEGIVDWLEEQKAAGAIRQLGFSYHGNTDKFCELIDAYDWDFCMIQYNYLDEHSQAGKKGLQYAASKGIPVLIMEPLRGGKLVNELPAKATKLFSEYEVQRPPVEWAFRWLWNQPEIMCVLSGMNSLEMVQQNVKMAATSKVGEFTEKDEALLKKVVQAINEKMKVGCTGCGYCMPCPKNVDIPGTFAAYNFCYTDEKSKARWQYIQCTLLRKDATSASQCVGCGLCEKHCPQHIEIRKELKNASKELETPFYKIAKKLIPVVMKY